MKRAMKKIELAKTAGFCFGVNRAVEMTYELVNSGKKVSTLGPLIHNPVVIEDLEKKGVRVLTSPEQAEKGSTVVVRTHGIGRSVMQELSATGAEVCDATCPFVKKIHRIVSENSSEDIPVLIAGDSDHPEVMGIMGYCNGECFTFKDATELRIILENHSDLCQKRITVVSQTTFSVKEWEESSKIINLLCTNANVFDTICNATQDRQHEATELSERADIMIIIGGLESSNTAKLKAVCEKNCRTYLVERAAELKNIDFSGCNFIGVTAGASTPARIIKEVLCNMSEILNEQPIELEEGAVEQKTDVADDAAVVELTQGASSAQPEEVPSNDSSDEQDFSQALEESLSNMNNDQKVKGVVMGFSPTEIQVDIGRKHAGYIPMDEYSADPAADPRKELKVGDEIDLIIMKTNDVEGTVMLSKRRYDAMKAWSDIVDAAETDKVFDGVVTDVVKGGVIAVTNGVRVFIPGSLATASRNEPLDDLLRKNVQFRIIEVNRFKRRAVGSIRAVLKEAKKAAEEAFWAQAEVGQKYTGTVKSLTAYGAFVDIGGVDGMIHISELSWKRIKHPSEVLSVGDEVEVYIKALDTEKKKISLGYRKDEDNPWEILRKNYPEGTVIEAEVVSLTDFGAFARVIPGIDGLIHISQIADRRIDKPSDVLKVGDKVQVKIIGIDFDKKRVSLSIRALLEPETEETAETEDAAE
ncbi:MAG: bifunctional 4-hydroxy-3-methylbut-2-enyl diphosphate reductase/30S ribosomal protein S1 [Clostridia bacterium]|nr:bifunctional 4-hydroxy-3-methylbut-2-enyl diphosphate reductase/30S ribosomal protein S1 [Clostridia bacterium]